MVWVKVPGKEPESEPVHKQADRMHLEALITAKPHDFTRILSRLDMIQNAPVVTKQWDIDHAVPVFFLADLF